MMGKICNDFTENRLTKLRAAYLNSKCEKNRVTPSSAPLQPYHSLP